jgi:hypothetical protein
MRAAWGWALEEGAPGRERDTLAFAADLGFDTLIVPDPAPDTVERGRDLGVRVVAIVRGAPTDAFAAANPDCLQRVHPVEEGILEALADAPEDYDRLAHRWYPLVHEGEFLCTAHEASLEHVEERVTEALEVADGVAFDGFGYRNHYACFCDRCTERRAGSEDGTPEDGQGGDGPHEYEVLARDAEETLVATSRRLYDHAKSVDPDALVTNHVWPPFAPNPYYGHRLRLDYCTQTVSWFYRPAWSEERVAFEAAEHARLAGEANTFVPFVGLFDRPYQRRPPERLRRELEIALEHGDGHVVLCTLGAPANHGAYERVVRDVLG